MVVSKHHFPDVRQMGDITKIDGATLPPVDIICAGSPCQNLSTAGNRKGLDGEQSGLFREATRVVREMREATNGQYPRWFVWENVLGAFSTNRGADFRAVLEEITETKIPVPQSGKWAECGMVRGERREIAWRVLDAQFWGVPQRRKRIFLIADFAGGGRTEVLFEPERLPRDIEESQDTRQNVTAGVEASTGTTSDVVYRKKTYANMAESRVAATLVASGGTCGGGSENLVVKPQYATQVVRRLTPLECERLQGLPDSFTDVEFKGKPASDNRRYKAIGNGMAHPCASFVLKQIAKVERE